MARVLFEYTNYSEEVKSCIKKGDSTLFSAVNNANSSSTPTTRPRQANEEPLPPG